ncbi:unnamed protein product, partial [Rotaria magnacalcarata]
YDSKIKDYDNEIQNYKQEVNEMKQKLRQYEVQQSIDDINNNGYRHYYHVNGCVHRILV